MAARQLDKRKTFTTILGTDESNEAPYEVTVGESCIQDGIHYGCVEINALDATGEQGQPKSLQVTYKEDAEMKGQLKFATVAIHEDACKVSDAGTVSKVVRMGGESAEHSEAVETKRGRAEVEEEMEEEAEEEIFASDPEALKFFELMRKPAKASESTVPKQQRAADEASEGVFVSDPETLKFLKPRPAGAAETASEGIFASDPDALKFVRLQPAPQTVATDSDEGIFASDPEALKFLRFGRMCPESDAAASTGASWTGAASTGASWTGAASTGASWDAAASTGASWDAAASTGAASTGAASTGAASSASAEAAAVEGVASCRGFASDPDALNLPAVRPTDEEAPSLLAEATNVPLKDGGGFNVRVSGHALPNGLQKKFVDVSSCDGARPPLVNVADLQVSVEEKVNPNGTVEKFVVVE